MTTASLVVKPHGGPAQFPRIHTQVWEVTCTATPGAVGIGADVLEAITVSGVTLNDAILFISSSADMASVGLSAYVSAANTVQILFTNNTAGAITPTAGATIKMLIVRPSF